MLQYPIFYLLLTFTTFTFTPTESPTNNSEQNSETTVNNPPTCATNPSGTQDADNDGIRDECDLDDDNDGIPDCVEKDLEGVNYIDLFTIAGDAIITGPNEIRLTPAVDNQAGSSFTLDRIDFSQDFYFSFEANLGNQGSGADGIAIVFHNDPAGSNAVGASGHGMGARGIQDGIVLELDTYRNSGIGDINTDHGMIWDSDNQGGVGLLTGAYSFGNIEDGNWRTVTVDWNATTQTITYMLGTTLGGTLTNDLVTNYFGGSNLVYFGFTASTGEANNDQRIRFPNGFCDFPLFVDFDRDGIENHIDLDSDNDGCPDFMEGDANFQTGDGVPATGTVVDGNGGLVTNNLGNTVGNNYGVDLGIPTVAGTGQGIGDSQDSTVVSSSCCNLSIFFKLRNVSCDSLDDAYATAVNNGGVPPFTYRWDAAAGNQTTPTISNLQVGSYEVTLTDKFGCTSRAGVIIEELTCPSPCASNPCVEAIVNNTDICLVLTNDPADPLDTLDCDRDGVINSTECTDGTNPLDPCDFVDTSITLPVTADQSYCPIPCPDLTPVVTVLPGNVSGFSQVEVAIQLTELEDVDTDGSVIAIRVPSDPRLLFVWSIGLTQAALIPVQNADWNYLGDNGVFHSWNYNGPGLVIPASGNTALGFQAFYDPQSTDGQTTITATVVPLSGGECNPLNNTDSERLVYFK